MIEARVFEDMERGPDEAAKNSWLPTPEEIAAECAAIQASWTRAERRKRAFGVDAMNLGLTIPVCRLHHA